MIYNYKDTQPVLGQRVYIAPTATVIGDVELGDHASVWFGSIVRGDVYHIRIGARTNIQDLSVLHVTGGKYATIIGDDVTVGHRVILHGCTIGNRVLVGMGAIIMDNAEVGDDSMVAAGALITPGKKFPPGSLIKGSPAKPARDLTDEERQFLPKSAQKYVGLAADYLDQV